MSFETKISRGIRENMFRYLLSLLVALSASAIITITSFAGCGSLTIAEMNWASAELMANVDKIILEKGYGCDVELVAGATMTTFTSMNEKVNPMLLQNFGQMLL